MQNFMGLSGYVWWQGVVEDRQDPLELGRARVRILGFHSEDKSKVPTDTLPWAYPAMPINSTPGSIPNLKEGVWVMGFFRDGESAQEPIMTHMIDAGFVTENDPNKGFNDPETNTDRPEKPSGSESQIGEVNTNKLARGITQGTLHSDTTVERKYPYNSVVETESGHLLELNDTPGSESLSVTHRSGSYYQIESDGKQNIKIVSDNFEIVLGDKKIEVSGDCNIEVDGDIKLDAGGKTTIDSDLVVTGDITGQNNVFAMKGMATPSILFGQIGGVTGMPASLAVQANAFPLKFNGTTITAMGTPLSLVSPSTVTLTAPAVMLNGVARTPAGTVAIVPV